MKSRQVLRFGIRAEDGVVLHCHSAALNRAAPDFFPETITPSKTLDQAGGPCNSGVVRLFVRQ